MIRIYLCAVASLNRSNLLHHCFFQVSLTHSFRKWFTRIIKCTFVLSENPVSWSYNSGKYCMTDSLKMWLIFSFVCKTVDRPRWDKTCDCSMTTSTITSLGTFEVFFFFPKWFCVLLPGCFHKKHYYVSHIVKSELRVMGSPHTDAGGAGKASPTFSKKSVIHAVVNVFWCFFLLCFQLIRSPCSLCSSLCRLTAACCSLHANQFIKFAVSLGPEQSLLQSFLNFEATRFVFCIHPLRSI